MSVEVIRRQTVKGLTTAGIPANDASIIADVALHAVDSAMKSLIRTTGTLDGPNWGNAHGIALQILGEVSRKAFEDLTARTEAAGMKHSHFDVDTRR